MLELTNGSSPEDEDPQELWIETPPGLMPNLAEWGIEEIETGVCEDTYENRAQIRANKGQIYSIFDAQGMPTGLIRVVTQEMADEAMRYRKTGLLEDPNDMDSDYVTGLNLILTPDADRIAPTWVLARTKKFLQQEDELEEFGPVHPTRLIRLPARCIARKINGTRCWNWSEGNLESGMVCARHRAKKAKATAKPDLIKLARARLESSAGAATDMLEHLMNTATSEPVRLQAAKEILDRAGVRGGIEVDTKVEIGATSAAELLAERLAKLKENNDKRAEVMKIVEDRQHIKELETVDAEVVEDGE